MVRKLNLMNDFGETLFGVRHDPLLEKNNGKFVILYHGFGGNSSEYGFFDLLSLDLVTKGYTVFRFDFSGCGKSGGKFFDITLSKQISEVKSIFNYVSAFTNKEKVSVVAVSFASLSVLASGIRPGSFVFIGATPDYLGLVEKFKDIIEDEHYKKLKNDVFELPSLDDYFNNALFIHGELDKYTPISEIKAFVAGLPPKRKDVLVYSGADHGLRPKILSVSTDILEWISQVF